jgi:hypothetical protein
VAGEECFGAGETLGGNEDVAAPPQDEGPSPLAAYPVADLVSDHGPQGAEEDGVSEVQLALLGEDARGYEDGLARQRHPRALGHHPEEDDQVPVVDDQVEDLL